MSDMQCLACIKRGLNGVCDMMYADSVSMNLLKAYPMKEGVCANYELTDRYAPLIQHIEKYCFQTPDCSSDSFSPNYCFMMTGGQIYSHVDSANNNRHAFLGTMCGTQGSSITFGHLVAYSIATIALVAFVRYQFATPAKKPEALPSFGRRIATAVEPEIRAGVDASIQPLRKQVDQSLDQSGIAGTETIRWATDQSINTGAEGSVTLAQGSVQVSADASYSAADSSLSSFS